jgi:uncharacterized glyoxalase superfamily metalloenzyme YdcJ
MHNRPFVSADEIRARFSAAMSQMYRQEVPQYGTLVDLVADVNARALAADSSLQRQFAQGSDQGRLGVERHGAIRLGTADELATVRRAFAVMAMQPVGYYDLSVAGVPVHATAFRPVADKSLARNPFRVFTSLLRLELIEDEQLRAAALQILHQRGIFTPRALGLIAHYERCGGLTSEEADEFVTEVRETFRWHSEATVSAATYRQLQDAHPLIADVVCFKGPHINHLTPRTLDIDAAQAEMPRRGISAKEIIEGPPARKVPILLRQTSFKALEERVRFLGEGQTSPGTHTARFGEIEQRGMALTRKGRALYDKLLQRAREASETHPQDRGYKAALARVFADFPDDLDSIRRAGLGFFRFSLTPRGQAAAGTGLGARDVEDLIAEGLMIAEPITYEDFLPVSAAGIFQSNLGGGGAKKYSATAAKAAFEAALGAQVLDEIELYEQAQAGSLAQVRQQLDEVGAQAAHLVGARV